MGREGRGGPSDQRMVGNGGQPWGGRPWRKEGAPYARLKGTVLHLSSITLVLLGRADGIPKCSGDSLRWCDRSDVTVTGPGTQRAA